MDRNRSRIEGSSVAAQAGLTDQMSCALASLAARAAGWPSGIVLVQPQIIGA